MGNNKLLKFFKLDHVIESVSGYVETRLELFKLETQEELSSAVAKLIQFGLLFFLILFALLLFTVAGCIALGELLNSTSLGFLIGGGVYLLLGITLYILKDQLKINEKINQYLGTRNKKS